MAVKTTATKSAKKDTKAPAKKAPAKTTTAKETKPAAKPAAKSTAKPAAKPAAKVVTAKKPADASSKTAYHVSKRDDNGREWKVFIQGSNKVIKLFNTQQEALNYAKSLCKNKDDGSYVLLHGLDGKMRKF